MFASLPKVLGKVFRKVMHFSVRFPVNGAPRQHQEEHTTANEPFNPLKGVRASETMDQLKAAAQASFNARLPQEVRWGGLF